MPPQFSKVINPRLSPSSPATQETQSTSLPSALAPQPHPAPQRLLSTQAPRALHGSSKAPSQYRVQLSARSAAACIFSRSSTPHPSSDAPSPQLPAAPLPPDPSRRPSPSPSCPESSS